MRAIHACIKVLIVVAQQTVLAELVVANSTAAHDTSATTAIVKQCFKVRFAADFLQVCLTKAEFATVAYS